MIIGAVNLMADLYCYKWAQESAPFGMLGESDQYNQF